MFGRKAGLTGENKPQFEMKFKPMLIETTCWFTNGLIGKCPFYFVQQIHFNLNAKILFSIGISCRWYSIKSKSLALFFPFNSISFQSFSIFAETFENLTLKIYEITFEHPALYQRFLYKKIENTAHDMCAAAKQKSNINIYKRIKNKIYTAVKAKWKHLI